MRQPPQDLDHGFERRATDAFARLWTAEAHWDAVEALQKRKSG